MTDRYMHSDQSDIHDAAAGSPQQNAIEPVLEFAHNPAETGLRDPACFRRLRHAAVFGHVNEMLQISDAHRYNKK